MLLVLAVSALLFPADDLIYVPPVSGPVLRHFEAPPGPYGPGHRGMDIAAQPGTTVRSPADGVVSFAGSVAGSLYVTVDHPDGVRTTSSFLSEVFVRRGDHVLRRTPLGRSGTGHPGSQGPAHVHFGARRGDEYIDPEPLLVASMRRDYADFVRLVPERDGKVFTPPTWTVLIPMRRSRFPRRRRSSSRYGAARRGRSGALDASRAGR